MVENPKVLLADCSLDKGKKLASFLRRAGGINVLICDSGRQVLEYCIEKSPDCIVVDVQLPDLNGRQVLRSLRQNGNWVPVVLLGEHEESPERAMALEEGADDYVLKRWDETEVLARIKAVLRRLDRSVIDTITSSVLTVGELRFNKYSRRVWIGLTEVNLTPRAVAVLEYLMNHPDKLISREELADAVWGWEHPVSLRAIDTRIAELRRVIEKSATQSKYIETVQGQGYRFTNKIVTTA